MFIKMLFISLNEIHRLIFVKKAVSERQKENDLTI
jgi:hypothetical protein